MKKIVYYIVQRNTGTKYDGPIETYEAAYWCWAEKYNGSDAFAIISIEEDIQ